ncbi:MAG: hypothetical protein WBB82_02725, partial [Limnothrix sp.]
MPESPVPKLDLAPKLNRPLQLWNPLDYLRLLYWIFYFPQAIRCYAETFWEKENTLPKQVNMYEGWAIFQTNPIQRNLYIQHIVLTIFIDLLSCYFLGYLGISIDWLQVSLIVILVVTLNIYLYLTSNTTFGVTLCLILSVVFCIRGGVSQDILLNTRQIFAISSIMGMSLSVATKISATFAFSGTLEENEKQLLQSENAILSILLGSGFGIAFIVLGLVIRNIAGILIFSIFIVRLDAL